MLSNNLRLMHGLYRRVKGEARGLRIAGMLAQTIRGECPHRPRAGPGRGRGWQLSKRHQVSPDERVLCPLPGSGEPVLLQSIQRPLCGA